MGVPVNYIFFAAAAIVILIIVTLLRLFYKKRKIHRQQEEISHMQRRNEALNDALRNPRIRECQSGPESPVDIRWDDKAVNDKQANISAPMIELTELTAYSRKRYVFRADQPICIGSAPTNQLMIARNGVAEQHCEVYLLNGRACVRSIPGEKTILQRGKNCALISEHGAFLNNGDKIQIASATLQFRMFKA